MTWQCKPSSTRMKHASGATKVLPSPVAISAILPSYRTMPPMSCTSKHRARNGGRDSGDSLRAASSHLGGDVEVGMELPRGGVKGADRAPGTSIAYLHHA